MRGKYLIVVSRQHSKYTLEEVHRILLNAIMDMGQPMILPKVVFYEDCVSFILTDDTIIPRINVIVSQIGCTLIKEVELSHGA